MAENLKMVLENEETFFHYDTANPETITVL